MENLEAIQQEYLQRLRAAMQAAQDGQENPHWPEEPTEEEKAAMWDYYYNYVSCDQNN